jgi:type I restriction enzyme S subunit
MEKQTVIARNEAISPTQSAPLLPHLRFKEFEDEWEKTNILSISEKVTDGTHDTPKTSKEGNPYLTAIHVKDGFINYNDCYYLSDEEHNKIYKRCNPEKGDLLMVNIGAGTATTALVKVDFQFSLKNVALIKPKKNIVDSNFFSQVQRMNSSRLRHQLSSGGAQPFLSLKEIGRLKLSIPKLPEQQKIASFLSAIDTKLQQLTTKKEKLSQYKKGVMQQLFSQQLRFKANDGSAFPDWEEKNYDEIFSFYSTNSYSRDNLNYEKGKIKNIHYGDIHTKFSMLFNIENEKVPFINKEMDLSKIKVENYCRCFRRV